jgi:hypothetical protein
MDKIVFLNECCVDGCYKKRWENHGMCKKHQEEYESCMVLTINYGKKVQRKIAPCNIYENQRVLS